MVAHDPGARRREALFFRPSLWACPNSQFLSPGIPLKDHGAIRKSPPTWASGPIDPEFLRDADVHSPRGTDARAAPAQSGIYRPADSPGEQYFSLKKYKIKAWGAPRRSSPCHNPRVPAPPHRVLHPQSKHGGRLPRRRRRGPGSCGSLR
jgi:hypothetical protein